MLSIKVLLITTGAMAVAAVVAAAVLSSMYKADWSVRYIAESIKAEKPAKVNTPVEVKTYVIWYNVGGESLQLYLLAVGRCPPPDVYMGVYTLSNNSIHLPNCSFLFPAIGEKIIHYYATCAQSTDFFPEAVELEYQFVVRLVIVKC